jgi:DNA-binding SARP family transcriptional activator
MTFEIHLLGSPRVVRDGTAMQAPRGHKVWGLLAYLLLRETPATRSHLAELLFPAADDPLAALRWNLSMLRRLLGDPKAFRGDPLICTWTQPPIVDVLAVRSAGPAQLQALDDLGHDLLESMEFPGCPSFEIWLEAQRRHARGTAESLLHEAALTRLARGDAEASADLAGRLVALNPYDENFQALLVRSLAVGGHGVEAARQAAACRELFRTELGVEPGPALDAAMVAMTSAPTTHAVTGRPAVLALVEAGGAAIGAGALEAGLQCLRRAVADATTLGDGPLTARCFTALGSALVHAARGSDEEGATALHRALSCEGAEPATLAQALGELAYVEFLHGRYDRVEVWLARASAVSTDPAQRATDLSVRGSTLSDLGRYPAAMQALGEALDLAQDERRRSYVLSMIGRVHLLRGELDAATLALDDSLALAGTAGWSAFVPWPLSLRAEVDLLRGDVPAARTRLEQAFALGCQIGDPCWEGLSARGLGLVLAAQGDVDGAIETLLDARRRAGRLPDAYVWVEAYILDALATIGVSEQLPSAAGWVAELAAVAERSDMAELTVRAAAHRWRLGDPAGREAARALSADVDNPVLARLLH